MGNHRTEKRRLTRLQKSINQEARILQLQLALDAAQQVGQNGTGAVHKEIPLVSPAQHSSQRSSDPESPMTIEDIKLPPNDEAHTIHVFQPDYDAEESAEVLHLETIGCSSGDVDVHALDDINFHGAGTQEPTKPYTICTGFWVCNKDNSLARSGITIWWFYCIFHCRMTCLAWICYVFSCTKYESYKWSSMQFTSFA